MLRAAALAGALILSASCSKSEGGDIGALQTTTKPGSGGFSSDLARELGAGPAKTDEAKPSADGNAGAGKAGADGKVGANSKAADSNASAGSKAADSKAADSKAADSKAADSKVADSKVADSKASAGGQAADSKAGTDGKAGDSKASAGGQAADSKAGTDGKAGDSKVSTDGKAGGKTDPDAKTAMTDTRAGSATRTDAAAGTDATAVKDPGAKDPGAKAARSGMKPAAGPASPPSAPTSHGPVKVPAELAAIKLSLLPNWDRDTDEAGTFQYVVRIKGTQSTKTFSFHYGYDDPKAPADRDQYKKYLQETGGLTGEIKDRQRGGAWFLEGTDATGPAFRYVVLYGGKRLICYGSLYKDAESNKLGDDRDQTLIQAKQICETLAL